METTVGYTGGNFANPTYEDIKSKNTGHAEAIEIMFDSEKLSYRKLLQFFFQIHDATTKNRQGNDIGDSYRSAIFYLDDEQKQTAQKLVEEINASGILGAAIVTQIVPASEFYKAEDYHQDYLERYPNGYTCHYIRPEWFIS